MVEVERETGVDEEVDLDAVGCDGGFVAQEGEFGLLLLRKRYAGVEVGDDLAFGPDVDDAALAIDDHQVAVFGPCDEACQAADGGNTHGAGDNGGVGAGAGFFQGNAGKMCVAIFE